MTRMGSRFDRCPKAWLRDEGADAVSMILDRDWLRQYSILPLAGGKLDQDPRFLDAVAILDAAAAELARAQAELDR